MPLRSVTWVRGLAMVSTNTSRVSGRSAAATASVWVASTKVTSTPCKPKVWNRLLVLPNRNALETKWSPLRSRANSNVPMAAMPVPKHTVATPCSMVLILVSSAVTVGLTWRA